MLRKRIIFSLIYSDGFFNQSRNFRLQKVGDEKWLENNYKFSKIAHSLDELILIDASKSKKDIFKFSNIITKIVKNVFIPICAGGGIRNISDAALLFNSGADKIIINTIIYENPDLVKQLIKLYGSQSIVASIDYKKNENLNEVYVNNGNLKIDYTLEEYLDYVNLFEVGEIYLNSIDKDGTGFGYDFDVIKQLSKSINKPLIIAGGAGNENHLIEGLKLDDVSAVATANLFNFIGNGLPNARKKIIQSGENLADWNK
jgi:cyclase